MLIAMPALPHLRFCVHAELWRRWNLGAQALEPLTTGIAARRKRGRVHARKIFQQSSLLSPEIFTSDQKPEGPQVPCYQRGDALSAGSNTVIPSSAALWTDVFFWGRVIVKGVRCAGSALAVLLARKHGQLGVLELIETWNQIMQGNLF